MLSVGAVISDERSVTRGLRCVNSVAWYVADLTGQIRGMRSRICQDMWVTDLAAGFSLFGGVVRFWCCGAVAGPNNGAGRCEKIRSGMCPTSICAAVYGCRSIARPDLWRCRVTSIFSQLPVPTSLEVCGGVGSWVSIYIDSHIWTSCCRSFFFARFCKVFRSFCRL